MEIAERAARVIPKAAKVRAVARAVRAKHPAPAKGKEKDVAPATGKGVNADKDVAPEARVE